MISKNVQIMLLFAGALLATLYFVNHRGVSHCQHCAHAAHDHGHDH